MHRYTVYLSTYTCVQENPSRRVAPNHTTPAGTIFFDGFVRKILLTTIMISWGRYETIYARKMRKLSDQKNIEKLKIWIFVKAAAWHFWCWHNYGDGIIFSHSPYFPQLKNIRTCGFAVFGLLRSSELRFQQVSFCIGYLCCDYLLYYQHFSYLYLHCQPFQDKIAFNSKLIWLKLECIIFRTFPSMFTFAVSHFWSNLKAWSLQNGILTSIWTSFVITLKNFRKLKKIYNLVAYIAPRVWRVAASHLGILLIRVQMSSWGIESHSSCRAFPRSVSEFTGGLRARTCLSSRPRHFILDSSSGCILVSPFVQFPHPLGIQESRARRALSCCKMKLLPRNWLYSITCSRRISYM